MWRFVDLTEAEKHERRQLLGHYAFIAQLLPLIPLLAISLVRLITTLLRGRQTPTRPSTPPKPPPTPARTAPSGSQIAHWLRVPVRDRTLDLGPNGLVLLSLLHSLGLLYLCCAETGEDYLHLTKRTGLVAASQLPWHYLLAWKQGSGLISSPVALLTGLDWPALNRAHRALGRILTSLFILHAVLYLNFFIRVGVLTKRLGDGDVVFGLTALILYAVLSGSAFAWVRGWNYALFVLVHVAVAVAVLPVMWVHVHHVRVFVVEAAAVWAVGTALRAWETRTVEVEIRENGKGLVQISFDGKAWKAWRAGQHLYVASGGKGWLPTAVGRNPFSIASLQADGKVRCMVRVMRGQTSRLLEGGKRRTLRIEGPYGRKDHVETLLRCDRVLFVAGGVGMTFILPLLRELIRTHGPRRTKIDAVWVVRAVEEVEWVFDDLAADERRELKERLTIYVTGAASHDSTMTTAPVRTNQETLSPAPGGGVEDTGIEMQSLLKNTDRAEHLAGGVPLAIPLRSGRPNLGRVLDQTFSHSATERVGVYVCGPAGMGDRAREEVGGHVWKGRQVSFWSEEFGLS